MLLFLWRYGLNGFILAQLELAKGFFSKWYRMTYLALLREFFRMFQLRCAGELRKTDRGGGGMNRIAVKWEET